MYACLHLPDFPLQALQARQPGLRWEAAGILEASGGDRPGSPPARSRGPRQPRLVAVTPSAAAAGVETGMTAAQAQARCGRLLLLERDPGAESDARRLLLQAAAGASSDFEDTGPGLVTVDLGSSPRLAQPGGLERLGHEWVAEFAAKELQAAAGFAPNPDLAALAARVARPARVFRGHAGAIRAQLAPLPLDALDPPADYRAILALWGVRTLGEFTALPRHEVAERLGPDAAALWDHAAGKRQRLLRLERPPADFTLSMELDYEITALEPLMFLIRRSVETLAARLSAAYLAAAEARLTLRFSDGRAGEQLVRVPDPSRDPDQLYRLIHCRLEDSSVPRPIEGYRLELVPARASERPRHLFERGLRDPNRLAETLAQIEALVGPGQAGRPVPLDSHQPDAIAMLPFEPELARQQGQAARLTLSDEAANPLPPARGLPLRRFRPPRPIDLATQPDPRTGRQRPAEILSGPVRGRVRDAAGPWLLSGEWWEPERRWRREEWDVELEDGILCRLVHCRQDQEAEAKRPAWYLEGTYG